MSKTNIYNSIGVETLIDCRGAIQNMLGSLRRPAVQAAIEASSQNFVQYDELADGIGQRLADLTGAEWGMISSGVSAGMKHVTAACISGGNPEKLIRIPDLTGLEKNEVIIPRYARNVYDHGIRNTGVTIRNVGSAEELEKAINSKTAMIYLTSVKSSEQGEPLSLEVIARIAKPMNIPILVDCAPDELTIPPEHLKRGATIVAYSGGKALGGPHCAGLLLGQKDILMSAWQASSPHHGPGRDNKVGREEMMGMLAAVEDWIKRDHKAIWKTWLTWLESISRKVSVIDGIKTSITQPTALGNKSPVLNITWDPGKIYITGNDLAEVVARTKPRMAIGNRELSNGMTSVYITPSQMQEGEDKIVAERLYELLSMKRQPTPAMVPPAVNMSGGWNVTIQFYSSAGEHSFEVTQDGNWISGTHKGDLDVRTVSGTIEGNHVKLKSTIPIIGDSLTFIFSGTVKGDSMSGKAYMGEYGTVNFKASRINSKPIPTKIMIPGGPPLAT